MVHRNKMFKSIFGGGNLGLLFVLAMCGFTQVTCQSLEMELPPKVTWLRGSQEMIIVMENRKVNYAMSCTAEGEPKPTIEWRRNDKAVSVNDEPYVKVFENGTLLFPDFGERENGYYQCVARNKLGVSASGKIQVVLQKQPTLITGPELDEPKVHDVLEGDPVSFKCVDTPPTYPESIKRWYLKLNTEEVPQDSRLGTDATGSMRFSYVELKDANTYVCALAPKVAGNQDMVLTYNAVILNVKERTKVPLEPNLVFASGNGNFKAVLNRTATLECFFSGFPVATVTWKDSSNHEITATNKRFKIEYYTRRLVIVEVHQEDEGTFTCTAFNGHGEKTASIFLNVTSAPLKVADKGLTSLIRAEFEDVTLKCQAKAAVGESLDTPVWYRNWDLFRASNLPDPRRYSFNADLTELYIRNISKMVDTACFQCNVTNSEGYTFYDGFLRVIDSIMITKRPKHDIKVPDNSFVDISVLAKGDACCKIDRRWYFNEQLLSQTELQTPPLMWDLMTDTIVFNTTDVESSAVKSRLGQYSVRVSNSYQEQYVEFTISKEETGPIVTADGGFQLWWLAIILGVLVIIIAILIIICCMKRNYPRETYQLEKTELQHNLNPKEELLDKSFQEI